MLFDSWFFGLLRAVPETIALVSLGMALVGVKCSFKQVAVVGAGIGLACLLLRQLPIQYGMHIPLGIIVYIIALKLFLKLNILKSAAAALLSFIILILIETVIMLIQTNFLGYTEEIILTSPDPLRFLFSLPPLVILIIFAVGAQVFLRYRAKGTG